MYKKDIISLSVSVQLISSLGLFGNSFKSISILGNKMKKYGVRNRCAIFKFIMMDIKYKYREIFEICEKRHGQCQTLLVMVKKIILFYANCEIWNKLYCLPVSHFYTKNKTG